MGLTKQEAFDRHAGRGAPDDCWIWQGIVTGQSRYGYVKFNGRLFLAHRVAHELFVGPIPEGMQVDHICRVRLCVNPAHLEAVTSAENLRRSREARGLITHCGKGHEFTPENTYERRDGRSGGRGCRACREDAEARRSR